jgi:cell division protein FtsB
MEGMGVEYIKKHNDKLTNKRYNDIYKVVGAVVIVCLIVPLFVAKVNLKTYKEYSMNKDNQEKFQALKAKQAHLTDSIADLEAQLAEDILELEQINKELKVLTKGE